MKKTKTEEQTERVNINPQDRYALKVKFVGYLYVYCTDIGITLKELSEIFKVKVNDVKAQYKLDKEKLEIRGIYFDEKKKLFYRKEWKFKKLSTGKFEVST